MNVCSYHLQEAGATPVQELAFALATAIAVLDTVKASGEVPASEFGNVVGRISFFVNAGIRFVTEICKMRAFTELWDEITRERYGVTDAKNRRFRYGVQVNSLGLTEQQPENNVYRILLEMLAVTLSKNARARAVQLPAWNEALGLPRPWDQQWSLRMQQILAYETDLLEYGDIFDGSTEIERKVAELKDEAQAELATIDAMGGAVAGDRLHEAPSGREQHRPLRRHRDGRADRRRRQQLLETEPSPLTDRRRLDHGRRSRRRGRTDRTPEGLAGEPRQYRRAAAALAEARARGQGRPQHHGAVDRLRQGRRHDGRMGQALRESSANTARPPASPRPRPNETAPASTPSAPPSMPSPPNSAAASSSWSASPASTAIPTAPSRSPSAPAMRHGSRLRGHPPDARADRARGRR